MDTSLELLKHAFEPLDIGIMVIQREDAADDESYTLVYANAASADLIGVKSEDIMGKSLLEAFPNVKEAGFLDIYARVLKDRKVVDVGEIAYSDERVEKSIFRCKFIPLSRQMLASIYVNITAEKQAQKQLQRQNEIILAMSTPIIELWKDILLLPLIGELDSHRAMQMIEHLLHAIVEHQARVAIFDITGVPAVDTQVAQYLMQSVQAARMLGAEVILTGISPETAITLVKLGVDISDIETHLSLHRGIRAAFHRLGLTITSTR